MKVILVDEEGKDIGSEEKIKVHKKGLLHRAFSIFIFNSKKELLLQKRSKKKYHSPELWSNTCCSHPQPGKSLQEEARKRLKEEMGFDCELREIFSFVYNKPVGNKLIEHEYDHVFIGEYSKKPKPDSNEVSSWKWISLENLKEDITKNPDSYTVWLKLCIDNVIDFFGT